MPIPTERNPHRIIAEGLTEGPKARQEDLYREHHINTNERQSSMISLQLVRHPKMHAHLEVDVVASLQTATAKPSFPSFSDRHLAKILQENSHSIQPECGYEPTELRQPSFITLATPSPMSLKGPKWL